MSLVLSKKIFYGLLISSENANVVFRWNSQAAAYCAPWDLHNFHFFVQILSILGQYKQGIYRALWMPKEINVCKASVVSTCRRIVSIFPHTATVVTVRPILQQWFTSQRVDQSKTAAICWRAFHGHWTKRKKYKSGHLALHLPSSGFSRILLTKNDFIVFENVV